MGIRDQEQGSGIRDQSREQGRRAGIRDQGSAIRVLWIREQGLGFHGSEQGSGIRVPWIREQGSEQGSGIRASTVVAPRVLKAGAAGNCWEFHGSWVAAGWNVRVMPWELLGLFGAKRGMNECKEV